MGFPCVGILVFRHLGDAGGSTPSHPSLLSRFFTKVGGEQILPVPGPQGEFVALGGVWCGGEGSLCPSHSSSQAMKKMYKACLKYPEWKQKHDPHFKPWLFPEQSRLPALALSELSLQHADSLENIDESSLAESKEDRGEGSDEDSLT